MRFVNKTRSIICAIKPVLLTSIFFAISTSLIYNPFLLTYVLKIDSFDRTMGQATFAGIDAALRIKLFMTFNLVFIPLCLLIGIIISYAFIRNVDLDNITDRNISEALDFLRMLSLCALAMTALFVFNKYNNMSCDSWREYAKNFLGRYSILIIPLSISIETLIYIRKPFCEFRILRLSVIAGLDISMFLNFLIQTSAQRNELRAVLLFYCVYLIVSLALLLLLRKKTFDFERTSLALVPISFGLLLAGMSLELLNVLNQLQIFVVDRIAGAKIVYVAAFCLSCVLYTFNARSTIHSGKGNRWETLSIVGLLLSLYYFTVIPPLSISAGTELFEQANHGLLVNDLLAWGKFPMINSFDAHTMQYSLGMIIYGVLNGDTLGASYYEYQFVWLLPTMLCIFLMYEQVFDKYFAFFFLLLVPYFYAARLHMAVISVVALIYAAKKKSFGAYLLLFFSVAVGIIYNLPDGFAYGAASILVASFLVLFAAAKEKRFTPEARAYVKALIVFGISVVALYICICLQQNISPIKRAFEFLDIAQSTHTWAFERLGDSQTVQFGLLYSVLPVVAVACLAGLIVKWQNKPAYYTACVFLLSYIMNWTRSLQRHTLLEGAVSSVIFTAILGIAFFLCAVAPKKKSAAVFFCGLLVLTVFFDPCSLSGKEPMAATAVKAMNSSGNYYEGSLEKVTRVDLSAPLDEYKETIGMIDTVIPQGETYLDLSGQAMLYALSGREKPVYPNQSVSEVNGKYSQLRFIEEVETEYDGICDFALVNTLVWTMNIDGVPCYYRYYLIMEYLYDNYRPLCAASDGYTLWVRNSRYEEVKEIDQTYCTPIDYDYLGTTHAYSIAQIPYLWGQFDSERAWENQEIACFYSPEGLLNDNIQENSKYISVIITAPSSGEGSVFFRDASGENLLEVVFALQPGTNRYVIRCSTDWWWNRNMIESFCVGTDIAAEINEVRFLADD